MHLPERGRIERRPVTIADDAILEVPPPQVDRRRLLTGIGVGITSLALPSATSAASVPTLEPSGAFSYPAGSGVVLYWTPFDTDATPTAVAGTGITDVSGQHGRGGTGSGAGDDPRVAADGALTTPTLASGTVLGSGSGAAVNVSADLGGAYSGTAGNLSWEIVSDGALVSASVSGTTLTINLGLGGGDRSEAEVSAAIGSISGLTASSGETGNSFSADDVGSTGSLSGGGTAVTTSLWSMRSTTSQLTLEGGSASPHLEWTITNGSASTLTVSTLVLYRVRSMSGGALNLAFYTSTSAGFASPVLRRTATFDNVTRHLVVPVGSGSGVALGTSQTLTVRAFPYGSPTDRDVRLIKYDSNDGDPLQGLLAADTVQTGTVGTRAARGDHVSAFIGSLPA